MRPEDNWRRWLDQARDDLRWAEHLRDAGGHHIACFLAQQVAEKALKALLYHHGEEIVLGHSVEDLCVRSARLIPDLASHCARWGQLDSYYVPTRYPDALPGSIPSRVYDRATAAEAVAAAREVVDAVSSRLTP